jgi:glycosyltransferase involved in cell wall biosynthesis
VKVIIGAYACEPSQGSEPAVGWHWAHEAVNAGHDVWVFTRRNNREEIERSLGAKQASPVFEYLDLPRPFLWLKHRFGHAGLLAYYYAWQIALAFKARRLHRRVGFDLAHHVTFVNDWLPSGLSLLPIPFVWGPVGGSTHRLPKNVELCLPTYARRHEMTRTVLQTVFRRMDPFVAVTRRKAKIILVYTREGLEGFSRSERLRARAVVHIGISRDGPARELALKRPTDRSRLHILTGGRLVHWKGYDLLIEGFARFARASPEIDARLIITGTGRFRPSLEALAVREGVGEHVDFLGFLRRRDDVLELMQDCDLYALPTLRDGPPVALLEAMGFGLPVLCLDLGATAELVPEHAAIKIKPISRSFIVAQIADACRWVSEHPDESHAMGQAARSYALEHHDWARVRSVIVKAYDDALVVEPAEH